MPKASSKKTYSPSEKEKYMCDKHKKYFTEALQNWKKDIIKTNNLSNILNSSDDNSTSADVVDQASSYTDKSLEMRTLSRSRKLIEKIEAALRRIKDGTYGYCLETGEPIGLKRLIANNSDYSPSSTYKWHDGRITLIEYQVDNEDAPEYGITDVTFACVVEEVLS